MGEFKIKEFHLTDEELAEFYSGLYEFSDLVENEYAFIYNQGKLVDKICWKGDGFRHVRYPSIPLKNGGVIAGRNEYQNLAIDLLQDRDVPVKLITGVAGSGKDLLMTSHALHLLAKGKFKKIVFIRPNVTLADVPDIGYLSGDAQEKLAWTLGPLYDKVGGEEELGMMMKKGALELVPLIHIRGRSFENSIVYVTEGQNLTKNLVKVLISRLGEGSELWLNGDIDQVDKKIYGVDNGFEAMRERLRGQELFGTVDLSIVERSEAAALCALLDD